MTMAAPKKPTAAAKPRARKAAPPAEEVTSDVDQAATSEAPARAPRASQKPAAASATPPESAEAETPPPAKKKRGKMSAYDGVKGPTTAYLYYQNEVREAVADEHPEMSTHQLMQEIGRVIEERRASMRRVTAAD